MRRLTMREVREQYGGILPPDAVFRPDDEPETPSSPLPPKPKPRGGRSERFGVLNAFIDFGISAGGLTPSQALVWLVLFRDVKSNGIARTGQTDIARRTGLSGRGVKLALKELKTKGFVQVVHRGQLNAGPSAYRVHPTGCMG